MTCLYEHIYDYENKSVTITEHPIIVPDHPEKYINPGFHPNDFEFITKNNEPWGINKMIIEKLNFSNLSHTDDEFLAFMWSYDKNPKNFKKKIAIELEKFLREENKELNILQTKVANIEKNIADVRKDL